MLIIIIKTVFRVNYFCIIYTVVPQPIVYIKTDFNRPIIMMLFYDTNKVLWSALLWAVLTINEQILQTCENLFVSICLSNLAYQELIYFPLKCLFG